MMRTMTLNQITAALAALVFAVVSLLLWALAVVLDPPGTDVPAWQWQPVTVQAEPETGGMPV